MYSTPFCRDVIVPIFNQGMVFIGSCYRHSASKVVKLVAATQNGMSSSSLVMLLLLLLREDNVKQWLQVTGASIITMITIF